MGVDRWIAYNSEVMESKEKLKEEAKYPEKFDTEEYTETLLANSANPVLKSRVVTQVLAVLAVSFGCYIHGTVVVYVAVATETLLNSTNPLNDDYIGFTLTHDEDIPLIASVAALGMLLGSLAVGPLCNL